MIKGFNINGNIERVDYESLENKPFYSETVTKINGDIVPLQEITLEKDKDLSDGCVWTTLDLATLSPMAPNVLYNFIFDGKTTQIAGAYIDEMLVFGNPSLGFVDIGEGEDTGEDYLLSFYYIDGEIDYPCCEIIYRTTEGKHTIGLSYVGDTVPLIPEDTYNFELQYDAKENWYYYDTCWDEIFGLHPQDGDKYKFTFGDTVCEITPVYDDNYECYLAGNLHIDSEDAEDTGENYFLQMYENYIKITPLNEGEYTVSLEKVLQSVTTEIVHKIDSKYLDIDMNVNVDVPYEEDEEGNVIFDNDIFVDGGDISVGTSIREINESINEFDTSIREINESIDEFDTSIREINETIADLQMGDSSDQSLVLPLDGMMSNATLEVNTTAPMNSSVSIIIYFYDSTVAERIQNQIYSKFPFMKIVFSNETNTVYCIKVNSSTLTNNQIKIDKFSFLSNGVSFPTDGLFTRQIQNISFYTDNGRNSHTEGEYTVALGIASHSEGNNTEASGIYSHSEGNYSKASGEYSHAEGNFTEASGIYSHSEGIYSKASGEYSHAEGNSTKANGKYSHAEGYCTTASGHYSHAEGNYSIASGEYSHAEGIGKASGKYSHAEGGVASGDYSHTEGASTKASGEYSHAEGHSTKANGKYSHAEGYSTEAGFSSHAEGSCSKAIGNYSHAEGDHTNAIGNFSHVQGRYNIEDTKHKYAHVVGNGEAEDSRSNAHTLDWEGNAWYAGAVEGMSIILPSSTEGSTKRFLITVDDTGTLSATEII